MGNVAAFFLRSLMIGLDQIVTLVERNDGVSKWHLGGYRKKMSAGAKLYFAVAAAAGRPSESVLL